MQSIGLVPRDIPGQDNIADLLTKMVSEQRMRWLLRKLFGLEVPRVNSSVSAYCRAMNAKHQVAKIFIHALDCVHSGAAIEGANWVAAQQGEGAGDNDRITLSACLCRRQR